eukprot:GHVN01038701.1.p1 GENE.GHVN01038701.1~~GHVN01038701.1.p1  ORF type:complete len:1027 (+),score=163.42 GHVN01038701.1:303-3383(+)
MLRFRPTAYEMKAYPLDCYPGRTKQAKAIMLMIMNNLDKAVAQFPHELVTYGGNGSVFSNWAQYHLVMKYLAEMTEDQTLVLYSGHPLGLFPSNPGTPRLILTNGMVIPNFSSREMYEKMYAQGVSQYGQMTAGSYCYIGPQGIVHGTTITILNAIRKYLKRSTEAKRETESVVYVSSGLGGMSGAQGKAITISGCVGVVAEVDYTALKKRFDQGWISEISSEVSECIASLKAAKRAGLSTAIGYHGNIVTLWEALAEDSETVVDLGSDQTSLHNPYMGGYYPVDLTYDESRAMMKFDPLRFKKKVQASLRRHVAAINRLVNEKGMRFWDYGNAFLVEAFRAGADIMAEGDKRSVEDGGKFRYPSYVQDIMGDIFSLGFGPFRWVCCSQDPADLQLTDEIAARVFREQMQQVNETVALQYGDNLKWIEEAMKNKLVVGSQARILYSDCEGRVKLALEFNKAVKEGKLRAPVVLSRDHHDVSGTDSPYRETSNIEDGSMFCADMAIQNVLGDAARGATWVSIHNGGGCGWGDVINGGFGMVLDGSGETQEKCKDMLHWDVCNGVTRRSWAGNPNAVNTIVTEMQREARLRVTMPQLADPKIIDKVCAAGIMDPKSSGMEYDLILTNCTLATMSPKMSSKPYGLIENGAVAVLNGKIVFVGEAEALPTKALLKAKEVKDCEGCLVTPGLIDCHTHVIYGGSRSSEWERRLNGASYEDIAKAGGGIVNTVKATREASVDEMVESARQRVTSLLREGVTTMEIKSGYGLELETERRQLQAAARVESEFGVKVVKTLLAAHSVPSEFKNENEKYINYCIEIMKTLHKEKLVDTVDAFCESIGFSVSEVDKLFTAASSLGIRVRLHGDQLNDFGSAHLVAKHKGLSCDHCEYTGDSGIQSMAEAGVVAVLLPASNYFIGEKKKPEVKKMREKKVDMAIATNCNPGSSPCCSVLLAMNLAVTHFNLTPEEALRGVTLNAAKALNLSHKIGSLEPTKSADICVWSTKDCCELSHFMGLNLLKQCYSSGQLRKQT